MAKNTINVASVADDEKEDSKRKGKKKSSPGSGSEEENERGQALNTTIENIEKMFGKGSVMKLGEVNSKGVSALTTGSLSIDIALGIGGIPRGRIIEIFGPESSGKSTLALHIVAEIQKVGGVASYVDAEHALDPIYAKKLGVNIDQLYISQPDDGEQALEIAEQMVRSGAVDVVIIDSVAALVPKAEIEGVMGDSHVGLLARLMSQALRKLTGIANKTNCTVVFINQLREKIGSAFMGGGETTTGGRALKFFSSVRIDIRRIESIKVGEEIVGNRTKVKIAKNKVAAPFKICEFDIMYGQGISREGDIIDLGVAMKLIQKSGSWYAYNDIRLGQGRENAKKYLAENSTLSHELENLIRHEHGLPDLEFMYDKNALRALSEDESAELDKQLAKTQLSDELLLEDEGEL